MIEPFAFLMPLWELQPFFTPYPLDLLVIDVPAFDPQKFSDLTITVAPIPFRQTYESQPKIVIIFRMEGFVALRRTSDVQRLTGLPFR